MRWREVRSECWSGSRACRVSSSRPAVLRSELTVDSRPNFFQRPALLRHPLRHNRFTHADIAVGTVVALEAGEQRPVARMLGAIAVTVQAVQRPGRAACRRVRLRRPRRPRNEADRKDFYGGDTGLRRGMAGNVLTPAAATCAC